MAKMDLEVELREYQMSEPASRRIPTINHGAKTVDRFPNFSH